MSECKNRLVHSLLQGKRATTSQSDYIETPYKYELGSGTAESYRQFAAVETLTQ